MKEQRCCPLRWCFSRLKRWESIPGRQSLELSFEKKLRKKENLWQCSCKPSYITSSWSTRCLLTGDSGQKLRNLQGQQVHKRRKCACFTPSSHLGSQHYWLFFFFQEEPTPDFKNEKLHIYKNTAYGKTKSYI